MDKPWKVIFAFVAVFIAGAVFGGVFTLRAAGKRLAQAAAPGRPQPVAQRPGGGAPGQPQSKVQGASAAQPKGQTAAAIGPAMMRQFTQRLKLSDEQRERIMPIVARAAEDLQRLRRENLQDTTRVMERMHLDIGSWLNPGQRTELEEMKRTLQERVSAERQKRGDAPVEGPARGSPPRPASGGPGSGPG